MKPSTLTKSQYRTFGPAPYDYCGQPASITALVRFDDECGNGQNMFSITGEIRLNGRRYRRGDCEAFGCLHEEITQAFPELSHLIKWHLCSTDGPLHYPDNPLFLAGDRDCWGHAAGDPIGYSHVIRFGNSPVSHVISSQFKAFLSARINTGDFQILEVPHKETPGETYKFKPKYTFLGYERAWHECPFDTLREAVEWKSALTTLPVECVAVPTGFSDGKPRELDAARNAAIWPDATDRDLTAPGLEARLMARLPALLEDFRSAVESIGFVW